jgi:hypothetical protein
VSQQRGAAGTEEGEDDDDSDSDDSDSDDSESGDSMDEDEEEAEQSVGAAAAPADDVELDEEEESDIELDDQSDAAAGSVFSPAPTAASGTAPKVRWTALPHISSHAPFTLRLARNTTDSPRSSFPPSLARSLAMSCALVTGFAFSLVSSGFWRSRKAGFTARDGAREA